MGQGIQIEAYLSRFVPIARDHEHGGCAASCPSLLVGASVRRERQTPYGQIIVCTNEGAYGAWKAVQGSEASREEERVPRGRVPSFLSETKVVRVRELKNYGGLARAAV
jgi:hypothetical protein